MPERTISNTRSEPPVTNASMTTRTRMTLDSRQRIDRLHKRLGRAGACGRYVHRCRSKHWRFDDAALAPGSTVGRRARGLVRLTHADVAVPEDWPLEASRLRRRSRRRGAAADRTTPTVRAVRSVWTPQPPAVSASRPDGSRCTRGSGGRAPAVRRAESRRETGARPARPARREPGRFRPLAQAGRRELRRGSSPGTRWSCPC